MNSKILLVDDDPAMLRLLEKYLTDAGYESIQATNGKEALNIVLAEAPAIIITDWAMPEMDGLELCRALRTHEGVRFAYIVIVTAYSDVEHLVKAFDAGADDFLSKPIRRPELMARLRAGIRIAQLEEDNAKRTMETFRLNAEMAVMNEKLKQMATTDELTGLPNRREAIAKLGELWNTQERYAHPFSCIILDIDHFKKFNDTYGHAAGDTVLRSFAHTLSTNIRSTDFVFRLGGEEFLIFCPNTDASSAVACAEHVRAAIENHDITHEGIPLHVTISCGVADCEANVAHPEELLQRADEALYQAKNNGRNRVSAYRAAAIVVNG